MVQHYEDFKALDVQLLAVSVDPPENARETKQELKIPFPVLSDSKHELMDAYGVLSPKLGPGGTVVTTPTRVLIDKTGTVRWIHQSHNDQARSPVSMVLTEAQKLK